MFSGSTRGILTHVLSLRGLSLPKRHRDGRTAQSMTDLQREFPVAQRSGSPLRHRHTDRRNDER